MKGRHVIMIMVIVIALSIVITNKGVETLTCTTKGELYEFPAESKLVISLKNKEIRDMEITIDIKLEGEMMTKRDILMQNIAAQGKSEVEPTNDGIRMTSGMSGSYFSSLGLSKDTKYSELKEVLEVQGFTCK